MASGTIEWEAFYPDPWDDIDIPDNGSWVVWPTTDVSDWTGYGSLPVDATVTRVYVEAQVDHEFQGDVELQLTTEYPTNVWHDYTFKTPDGGNDSSGEWIYRFTWNSFYDGIPVVDRTNDLWYLKARDVFSSDTGELEWWHIEVDWSAPDPQPDLIIQDVWTTPGDPDTDDTVELWARVKNQGSGDAGRFWVSAYVDGAYIEDENLYWGLDAGDWHDEKIAVVSRLSAGSHSLLIKADMSPENGHHNLIAESNEGNNTRSESFSVLHPNRDPDRPGDPYAINVRPTTARIEWRESTDPDHDPLTYEVLYKPDHALFYNEPLFTSTPWIELPIERDIVFDVKIRARDNRGGVGPWSRNEENVVLPVYIEHLRANGTRRFDEPNTSQPLWLVIHGMNSRPNADDIDRVANSLRDVVANDGQVFTVDWRSLATASLNLYPLYYDATNEGWIPFVAAQLARQCESWGVTSDALGILGHSWGAAIAGELAAAYDGGVHSLVAIDPAEDIWLVNGGSTYDPDDVDFSTNATNSWSFLSSVYGSTESAGTAHSAFVVADPTIAGSEYTLPGRWLLPSSHSEAVYFFSSMLTRIALGTAGGVSELFDPTNMTDQTFWTPGRYDADDSVFDNEPVYGPRTGDFAAVIGTGADPTDDNHWVPERLFYFSWGGGNEQVRYEPRLILGDSATTEGDSGTKTMTFTVQVSPPSTQSISLDFHTSDGTARESSDYFAVDSGLDTVPLVRSFTLTVIVRGDRDSEPDETLYIDLRNVVNADVIDGRGLGTIRDDDVARLPEIELMGNGRVIADGDDTPSPLDGTDLGLVSIDGSSVDQEFTITNRGNEVLHLTGSPRVKIQGREATDFHIPEQPSASIAPGGSATFRIRFDPSVVGERLAMIVIGSDDADENPYTFAIRGVGTGLAEIDVQGRGYGISSGDNSPGPEDGTDFGSVPIAGWVDHRFTIRNLGQGPLSLTGDPRVRIDGSGDFRIILSPPRVIDAGDSAEIVIRFEPAATGWRDATITIDSDDADEGHYTFAIRGTGEGSFRPEVDVRGNGVSIVNGDRSPRSQDGTLFGSALAGVASIEREFWILNTGTEVLRLQSVPSIQGLNADDFGVIEGPPEVITPGARGRFVIRFAPMGLGEREAIVRFDCDDADEDVYTFAIGGHGAIVPDDAPTVRVDSVPDITVLNATEYRFRVQYRDDIGLDLTSIGSGDVMVTGPDGYQAMASVVTVNAEQSNTQVTVEYAIWARGEMWDEGLFTIHAVGGCVWDTGSNPVEAQTIDTFSAGYSLIGAPGSVADGTASQAEHWVVIRNDHDELVVFNSRDKSWEPSNLTLHLGAPSPTGDAIIWTDPRTGAIRVAGPSDAGFILYTCTSTGWSWRNLSDELGTSELAPTRALTYLITRPPIGAAHAIVAGMSEHGDLVAFEQRSDQQWTFLNISDDLRSQGMTTPDFDEMISYVTSWDQWTLAGVDPSGAIQGVWVYTAQFAHWRVDDLSAITGADPIVGQLDVTLTTWGGIRFAGADEQGRLMATWWNPARGPGNWTQTDLTAQVDNGGTPLVDGILTAWFTADNIIAYAGYSNTGDIVCLYWHPGGPEGVWYEDVLTEDVGSRDAIPVSRLATHLAGDGCISIIGMASEGEVMRLWWAPGDGDSAWALENLSSLARG